MISIRHRAGVTSLVVVTFLSYDAVAYWDERRPAPGTTAFEYRWSGAVWRFATAGRRARFANEPERFAPQFGGYCAYAVGHGYTADGDLNVWPREMKPEPRSFVGGGEALPSRQ